MRSCLPIFYSKAELLRDKWAVMVASSSSSQFRQLQAPTTTVDILDTISHMALDIIGLAGFGCEFDCLGGSGSGEHHENELSAAFAAAFNQASQYGFLDIVINWLPFLYWVVGCLSSFIHLLTLSYPQPTKKERGIKRAFERLQRIGAEIVKQKKRLIMEETMFALDLSEKEQSFNIPREHRPTFAKASITGRDLLSTLIRANMAHDLTDQERLSDREVIDQISTFLVAGHETTSTSLSWTLLSLASHPDVQDTLREECRLNWTEAIYGNTGPNAVPGRGCEGVAESE